MVAYCTTLLAGGTCTPNGCPNRHDILRCEPCGCSFPADLLNQHSSGKKHLRNITTASDPRVTVSPEGGLDFVVEGTEVARRSPFPLASLAILIEKTEVMSSLSVAVKLFPDPGTPESCFTVSVSGEVVRRRKPRKIFVSFQAPHAGAFRTRLQIVFTDNTRPSGSAHLREPVSLPGASLPTIGVPTPITSDPPITVSHEKGLYFVVEGIEIAGQHSFSSVDLPILIEKTEVASSLTFTVKLFPAPGTPESCFTVSVSEGAGAWKESHIFVSFQAPDAGTFRTCLQITFNDNAWPGGKKSVVLREL
ncbi:hypothetical protein EDB87DRAFT_763212 [Lactarius vividus]|nr:hypothetical protein EDB87DRAFT_763212 [Lactarius vividus]